MNPPQIPRNLKTVVKYLIGISLLLFLISRIPPAQILDRLKQVDISLFICALFCFIAIIALQALRQYILVREYTGTYGETLKIVWIGFFFNHLLPTNVGGDVYKMYYLKKKDASWGRAFALITLDRVTALAVIFILGSVISLSRLPLILQMSSPQTSESPFDNPLVIIPAFAAILLLAAVVYTWRVKIKTLLSDIKKTLKTIPRRSYYQIVLLSAVTFCLRVLKFYFFILCFNQSLHPFDLVAVVFLANLAPLLPVTPGGLGLMEGALFLGLTFFQVSHPAALGVALLNRFTAWTGALAGGILHLLEGRKK